MVWGMDQGCFGFIVVVVVCCLHMDIQLFQLHVWKTSFLHFAVSPLRLCATFAKHFTVLTVSSFLKCLPLGLVALQTFLISWHFMSICFSISPLTHLTTDVPGFSLWLSSSFPCVLQRKETFSFLCWELTKSEFVIQVLFQASVMLSHIPVRHLHI